MQRELETKHALFSNLHLALFAWNLNYARQIPVDLRPTAATWTAVLVSSGHLVTPAEQFKRLHMYCICRPDWQQCFGLVGQLQRLSGCDGVTRRNGWLQLRGSYVACRVLKGV